MKTIRVFEAFAGYGSQLMALERLQKMFGGLNIEPIGYSEIDPIPIKAYELVHGTDIKNYGDISKIDWNSVPDFDLFTYSSPCTDISNSGIQKGFEKGSGTRSSLLWECEKTIKIKRPKYLLLENVKALVSKKFLSHFHEWCALLDSYGYKSFYKVLNACDYGVPQNRERVFMVSILRTEDDPDPQYYFPKPFELDRCLKDVLEEDVDEKYYLKQSQVDLFLANSVDGKYER